MIRDIIANNEKILWEGKPHLFLYVLGNPFVYLFALFWGAIDLFMFSTFNVFRAGFTSGGFFSDGVFAGINLFFLLHAAPVWYAIFSPIVRLINYSRIEYAITDRRVYLTSGILGRDIANIEYRTINNLIVNVGILENIFKVGTLRITNAASENNHPAQMKSIKEPYEVYKLLKQVSLDVTTDQYYPNAYRPKENPGYNTEYKGPDNQM